MDLVNENESKGNDVVNRIYYLNCRYDGMRRQVFLDPTRKLNIAQATILYNV